MLGTDGILASLTWETLGKFSNIATRQYDYYAVRRTFKRLEESLLEMRNAAREVSASSIPFFGLA